MKFVPVIALLCLKLITVLTMAPIDGDYDYHYLQATKDIQNDQNANRENGDGGGEIGGSVQSNQNTAPVNARCNSPFFSYEYTKVTITCYTDKVYPEALFFLAYGTKSHYGSCTNTKVSSNPVLYSAECTWTAYITDLESGQYYAYIYPNSVLTYNVSVQSSPILNLTLPVTDIAHSCLNNDDLIDNQKPSSNVLLTCNCTLKNSGTPPGQAKWLTATNTFIPYSALKIAPVRDNNIYICQGDTNLKNGNLMTIKNYIFANETVHYIEESSIIRVECPSLAYTNFNISLLSGETVIREQYGKYIYAAFSPAELRSITRLICYYDNINLYHFAVTIVKLPENVICRQPKLSSDNTSFSIVCKTTKVFPTAKCVIYQNNEDVTVHGIMSYTNNATSESPAYYITECLWTSYLSRYSAGSYSFDVFVHPNRSQRSYAGIKFVNLRIDFVLPVAILSNDCFNSVNLYNGFTRPNTKSGCLCYLSTIGYPMGAVSWYDNNNVKVEQNFNFASSFLNFSPSNDSMPYQCKVISQLNNTVNILKYEVKYAESPNACTLSPDLVIIDRTLDICHADTISRNFTCTVPNARDLPGVVMTIYLNEVSIPVEKITYKKDIYYYRSQVNITLTNMNNISVTCKAQNTKFSEITTRCFYNLKTRTPPKESPTLLLSLSGTAEVQDVVENTTYMLNCSVYGGTPPVCNMTVSCGNITMSTQYGNIFTSSVTFTRHMTGQMCTCTAQHVTGSSCYDNNVAKKKLNILYPAGIENFRTMENTTILDNGKMLNLTCQAVGNPAPDITIYKEHTGLMNSSINMSAKQAVYQKIVSCKDAGVYKCIANNTGAMYYQYLTLYVNCPLEFNNLTENIQVTTDKDFSAEFILYGFPFAADFYLLKFNKHNKNNVKILLNISKNNSGYDHSDSKPKVKREAPSTDNEIEFTVYENLTYGINLKYQNNEPPYSVVKFKLLIQDGSDFTNYSLAIVQPTKEKLEFDFTINKANETVNIVAIIGGSMAAFVVFIAGIIVLIILLRRYKGKCFNKPKPDPDISTRGIYSDLTISPSPNFHSYEKANIFSKSIINLNFWKNKRYCNVGLNSDIRAEKNVYIIQEDISKAVVVIADPKPDLEKQVKSTALPKQQNVLILDKKANNYDTIDVEEDDTNKTKIKTEQIKKSFEPITPKNGRNIKVEIRSNMGTKDVTNHQYDAIDVTDDTKQKRSVHIISEDKTKALVQLSHEAAQPEVNKNLNYIIHQYEQVDISQ